MKKINKFDLFLCLNILVAGALELTLFAMENSLGEQIHWLRVLTLTAFVITVVILFILFIVKVISQIKESYKEKKAKNNNEKISKMDLF